MSYLPELRASLVRAAERQAREDETPRRSRGWFGVAAAVGVAVAVVAVAIVLVGHRPGGDAAPAGDGGVSAAWPKVPPAQLPPRVSPPQGKLITQAQRATIVHDPACQPMRHLPAFSPGSPGHALTSLLGVLRRPRTPADSLPIELFQHGPRGVQLTAIRLARTDRGTSLYIVPVAGLGFRPVPARCAGEERAALVRAMRGSRPAAVRATVTALGRTLAWQQYAGRRPEAVCLAEADHKPGGGPTVAGAAVACGWGVAEIEAGLAGLGSNDTGAATPRVHGIVPDGVASVTLEFPRDRRAVNAKVVGNVFTVRLPRGIVGTPSSIVWRAGDGIVIRTARVP